MQALEYIALPGSSKNIVKYKLSKKPVAGYEHLGRLVGCLTQWN